MDHSVRDSGSNTLFHYFQLGELLVVVVASRPAWLWLLAEESNAEHPVDQMMQDCRGCLWGPSLIGTLLACEGIMPGVDKC